MGQDFLERKANGEIIPFSELLLDIPTDEVLAELFPYNPKSQPYLSHIGLKLLKLRLDGSKCEEIADMLHLTISQVKGRISGIKRKLQYGPIPDYIEMDIPDFRRLRGMEVPNSGSYAKLSELLRDMPPNEVLFQIDREQGNALGASTRRRLTHADLCLLQKKAAGQTEEEIGRELRMSHEKVRRTLLFIRRLLVKRLEIEIDMPELFPCD